MFSLFKYVWDFVANLVLGCFGVETTSRKGMDPQTARDLKEGEEWRKCLDDGIQMMIDKERAAEEAKLRAERDDWLWNRPPADWNNLTQE